MGCKEKKRNCQRTHNKKSVISVLGEKEIASKNLREKGRLQYFYHSPSSELPVRDVLGEQKAKGKSVGQKTEPHIEIGAENYINCCYQRKNIVPFLKSEEKYLFLFTTCKCQNLKVHYGEKFVVGYIIKMKRVFIDCNGHRSSRERKTLFI